MTAEQMNIPDYARVKIKMLRNYNVGPMRIATAGFPQGIAQGFAYHYHRFTNTNGSVWRGTAPFKLTSASFLVNRTDYSADLYGR